MRAHENAKFNLRSILIIEFGTHYKILEQLAFLFKEKFNLSFLIYADKKLDYRDQFISHKDFKIRLCDFGGLTIFPRALFLGKKHEIILVCTPPEETHWLNIPSVFFYVIFVAIFRRKVIIAIRNTNSFIQCNKGFLPRVLNLVRGASLKFQSRLVFETETMRRVFRSYGNSDRCHLGVIYDKYSDYQSPQIISKRVESNDNPTLVLGLTGGIDPERRDYLLVEKSLLLLNKEVLNDIKVITLGGVVGDHAERIITSLKNIVHVDYKKGFLSEHELITRGKQCSILLSPLSIKKPYGTLTGTGSIGDAIFFKRKIVLPSFADPHQEFKDFASYYTDEVSLAQIIKSNFVNGEKRINERVFDKYSAAKVRHSLSRDLALNL